MKTLVIISLFILFLSCSQNPPSNKSLSNETQSYHRLVNLEELNKEDLAGPDFSAIDTKGDSVILSDYRGKLILLNYWGVWCGPCMREMPDFVELQTELGDKIQFIGISTKPENNNKVNTFSEKVGINYPLIIDDEEISKKYPPHAWPSTYILSNEGKPMRLIIGSTTKELLKPVLDSLLAGI